MDFFSTVPKEIMLKILLDLNLEEVFYFETLSKRFYTLIHDNNELWYQIYNASNIRFAKKTFGIENHEVVLSTKESKQEFGPFISQYPYEYDVENENFVEDCYPPEEDASELARFTYLDQDELTGDIANAPRLHKNNYSEEIKQKEKAYVKRLQPTYNANISYRDEVKVLFRLQCKQVIFDTLYGLVGSADDINDKECYCDFQNSLLLIDDSDTQEFVQEDEDVKDSNEEEKEYDFHLEDFVTAAGKGIFLRIFIMIVQANVMNHGLPTVCKDGEDLTKMRLKYGDIELQPSIIEDAKEQFRVAYKNWYSSLFAESIQNVHCSLNKLTKKQLIQLESLLKIKYPGLFELYSPFESALALSLEEFTSYDYWLNRIQYPEAVTYGGKSNHNFDDDDDLPTNVSIHHALHNLLARANVTKSEADACEYTIEILKNYLKSVIETAYTYRKRDENDMEITLKDVLTSLEMGEKDVRKPHILYTAQPVISSAFECIDSDEEDEKYISSLVDEDEAEEISYDFPENKSDEEILSSTSLPEKLLGVAKRTLEEHKEDSLNYKEHWVGVPNKISRFDKNTSFSIVNIKEIDEAPDEYESDDEEEDEFYDDYDSTDDAQDIAYYGYAIPDHDSEEETDQVRYDLRKNSDNAILIDIQEEKLESAFRKYSKILENRNEALLQRISNNDEKIEILKFNTISETKETIPELLYNLSQALLLNTNLHTIEFFMVSFNVKTFDMMLNALGKHPVSKLRFRGTNLSPKKVDTKSLGRFLATTTTVESLVLNDNALQGETLETLISDFGENKSIKNLSINSNGINKVTLLHLAKVLGNRAIVMEKVKIRESIKLETVSEENILHLLKAPIKFLAVDYILEDPNMINTLNNAEFSPQLKTLRISLRPSTFKLFQNSSVPQALAERGIHFVIFGFVR